MKFPHLTRRGFQLAVLGSGLNLVGCANYYDPSANPMGQKLAPMTPEQEEIMAVRARMIEKFKVLQKGGVGWSFGAKAKHEFLGVTFFRETNTERVFFQSASLWRETRVKGSTAHRGSGIESIPERARVVYREDSTGKNDRFTGKIIGQHIIDVGLAVPDPVLDDIRQNGGGLELQFMLAPETCYFGWVVWRPSPVRYREGHKNGKRIERMPVPYRAKFGGNFAQAYINYEENPRGELVKGWHIDPRTGKKVETDI